MWTLRKHQNFELALQICSSKTMEGKSIHSIISTSTRIIPLFFLIDIDISICKRGFVELLRKHYFKGQNIQVLLIYLACIKYLIFYRFIRDNSQFGGVSIEV